MGDRASTCAGIAAIPWGTTRGRQTHNFHHLASADGVFADHTWRTAPFIPSVTSFCTTLVLVTGSRLPSSNISDIACSTKRFREEGRAEANEPAANFEEECSESYQTAVAEGERHPKLLRDTLCARNKIRTAPLWGLRLRSRFMHDGNSVQLDDAVRRHSGESSKITERFLKLKPSDQKALLTFLQSL